MLYESLEHICYAASYFFFFFFFCGVSVFLFFFHFRLLLKRLWLLRQCLLIHFKKFSVIDHLYLCSLLLCVVYTVQCLLYIYIFLSLSFYAYQHLFSLLSFSVQRIQYNKYKWTITNAIVHIFTLANSHLPLVHNIKVAIFSSFLLLLRQYFVVFFPSKLQYNRFMANTFPCINKN